MMSNMDFILAWGVFTVAINVYQRFGSRANPADANYTNGSYKNETTPGVTNDGTPLDVDTVNDVLGGDDALFASVFITVNGVPDTAIASQRQQAREWLIDKQVLEQNGYNLVGYFDGGANNYVVSSATDVIRNNTNSTYYIYSGNYPHNVTNSSELEWVEIPVHVNSFIVKTQAEIQIGGFKLGDFYYILDRAFAPVIIESTGTGNGYDSILMNDGNYANLILNGLFNTKWFGVVFDGTTVCSDELQAALNSNTPIFLTGGTIDLDYNYVTAPAGARISGNATLLGGIEVGGDDVQISGITCKMTTGLDNGNLKSGIKSTNQNDLLIDRVIFDTCSISIANDRTDYEKNYSLTRSRFIGDVGDDAYAQSVILQNVDSINISANYFYQDNLYRILKITAKGYDVDEVIDENYSKNINVDDNWFYGSIAATGLQHIDLYASASQFVFTDNNVQTTGGTSCILTKAEGGTGPKTEKYRNIKIDNNIFIVDVSENCIDLGGSYGKSFDDPDFYQNASVTTNSITMSNDLSSRAISIKSFNTAIATSNDVNYTGQNTTFYGVELRANQKNTLTGGELLNSSVSVSMQSSDPNIEVVTISGVTIDQPRGRGIDMSIDSASAIVTIGICSFRSSGYDSIRVKNCTFSKLVMVGNVSTDNGFVNTTSTITKIVDANNSWNS